jgi:ADP-ribose pyrophosphatase YjhB (NUDIX family)
MMRFDDSIPNMAQKASLYCRMIVLHNDAVLLVREQGPDDPHPLWLVPGGSVEEDESPLEAAIRETKEETGIRVTRVKSLVWCNYLRRDGTANSAVAFNFLAEAWEGDAAPDDPDGLALHAEFVPIAHALEWMDQSPWRYMCEPVMAYLRGDIIPGGFWHIEPCEDGAMRVIEAV